MKKDQVYRCSLTIRLVKKSHDGRKTLDTQLVHIPIMGGESSEYHIDYHVCLPKYFHLSRKSLSVISGQIEIRHGHAVLSNNHQTFVYEMNAGVLVVRYINQNYQEVGHGLISRDMETNLLNVTHQVPVPRGYHCDYVAGYRINKLAQSLVIRVKGNSATLQQSALEIIKQEVNRNGRSVRQQVHTIHISGLIGDSFSLHPADYQFPNTVPAASTTDVNGIITPNGVDPVQVKFTYIKVSQKLPAYPLTVKILKKDGDQLNSRTVVKSVRGKLRQRYHYSYRDFQPKGYQLDPSSLKAVDGQITADGLSRPAVAFIYDRVKIVQIKYVNQNHQTVGSSQLQISAQVRQNLRDYLKLPTGYRQDDKRQIQQNADGITVPVSGQRATPQQSVVKLQIIKRQPNGQLIGQFPKTVRLSGNIGDRFQIDPVTQCPQGFLNRHNRPVKGVVTANGTRADHHHLTYVKKPTIRRILVRYVTPKHQVVHQRVFSGAVGKPFDQSWLRKSMPDRYQMDKVVSGGQVNQFKIHDQIVVAQIKPRPVKKPSSSASAQATIQHQLTKPQVQKDSARASAASAGHRRPSTSSSRFASAHDKGHSRSAQSASAAKSSSSNSAARSASSKSSRHINVVKKAFMYRCYNEIFSVDLMDWAGKYDQHQVQVGVQLANNYIRGIKDALNDQHEEPHHDHSYHYGYQSSLKFAKHDSHPTVIKVLMAVIKASSLIKI